jgi:hypothetical protein
MGLASSPSSKQDREDNSNGSEVGSRGLDDAESIQSSSSRPRPNKCRKTDNDGSSVDSSTARAGTGTVEYVVRRFLEDQAAVGHGTTADVEIEADTNSGDEHTIPSPDELDTLDYEVDELHFRVSIETYGENSCKDC